MDFPPSYRIAQDVLRVQGIYQNYQPQTVVALPAFLRWALLFFISGIVVNFTSLLQPDHGTARTALWRVYSFFGVGPWTTGVLPRTSLHLLILDGG
jgi:hypothetical protein